MEDKLDEIIPLLTMNGEACALQGFLNALALMHEDDIGDALIDIAASANSIACHLNAQIQKAVRDAQE